MARGMNGQLLRLYTLTKIKLKLTKPAAGDQNTQLRPFAKVEGIIGIVCRNGNSPHSIVRNEDNFSSVGKRLSHSILLKRARRFQMLCYPESASLVIQSHLESEGVGCIYPEGPVFMRTS